MIVVYQLNCWFVVEVLTFILYSTAQICDRYRVSCYQYSHVSLCCIIAQFVVCADGYAICMYALVLSTPHLQAPIVSLFPLSLSLKNKHSSCRFKHLIYCYSILVSTYAYTETPSMVCMCLSFNIPYRAGGVFLLETAGKDFAQYSLLILLVNFLLYLIYYSITKCVYREVPSVKPIIYSILAFATWGVSIYFFTRVSKVLDSGPYFFCVIVCSY